MQASCFQIFFKIPFRKRHQDTFKMHAPSLNIYCMAGGETCYYFDVSSKAVRGITKKKTSGMFFLSRKTH